MRLPPPFALARSRRLTRRAPLRWQLRSICSTWTARKRWISPRSRASSRRSTPRRSTWWCARASSVPHLNVAAAFALTAAFSWQHGWIEQFEEMFGPDVAVTGKGGGSTGKTRWKDDPSLQRALKALEDKMVRGKLLRCSMLAVSD